MKDSLLPNWDPSGEEWPLLFSYTKLVKISSLQAACAARKPSHSPVGN